MTKLSVILDPGKMKMMTRGYGICTINTNKDKVAKQVFLKSY